MLAPLKALLDTSDFPPRWYCGSWTSAHGFLHVLSDLGVWSAYLAIPCVIGAFVLRRRDIPFRLIFVLFGAFILACGTTHLMEALIFWWPAYRLAGAIKLATALVSWCTVVALVRVTPEALAMRTPEALEREIEERKRVEGALERRVSERTDELAQVNAGLLREVEQRRAAEARLQQAHDELEERVRQRTAELTEAVEALRRSEAMFQGLFQFAPDAVLVSDAEGRIRQANLQAERTFGYAREELIGQPIEVLIPERFHESHRRHRDQYHAAPRSRRMGEGRDLFARRKDGSELPADVMLAPLETPNGPLTLSTVRDISHRKVNESIIKARARQQAALAELGQRALASADLAALLADAVALAARTLDADLGRYAELAAGGIRLVVRAAWGCGDAHVGADLPCGPGSQALHCLALARPLVVHDLRAEARFAPCPGLLAQGAVSGLGVAIAGKAGLHGLLDAHSRKPRGFTAEDVVFLHTFANLLAAVIDRAQAERQVQASLAEKEVLLREIHHRVKNNLQVVCSLLDLQSSHTETTPAVEMLQESRNRVRSMALVHERLYRSADLARVDLAAYVERLAEHLFQTYQVSGRSVRLEVRANAPLTLPIDAAVPCGLLLNELLSNCIKHAFRGRDGGTVRVELRAAAGQVELCVADDGVGLPEGLEDFAAARSFGLQLVAMLAGQLRAATEVRRQGGTAICLTFPLPRQKGMRLRDEG
jgi:PAS domain S-box-containing protein